MNAKIPVSPPQVVVLNATVCDYFKVNYITAKGFGVV